MAVFTGGLLSALQRDKTFDKIREYASRQAWLPKGEVMAELILFGPQG